MALGHRLSDALIGCSPAMKEVFRELVRVGQSKATVLLRGESGTGKELIAKLIHENSPRAGKPFIKVNCAALSETLLESELFGHEKGSFTGAIQMRKGRFELADGGTIFLDEIGDLPLPVQVKLLRVLQEMEFERVGGVETLSVDVRTIAATHRELENAILDGTFRQDLYYRLNVVPIRLPPLRERREDIPLLISHFLDKFNKENNKKVSLSNEMIQLLIQYDWPGNVRELENCTERLVVLAEEESVNLKNIPPAIETYFNDIQKVTAPPRSSKRVSLAETMQGMEQEALKKALERCGWVQAKAARLLGMTPRQVAYKIKKYNLCPQDPF
jgi:Nif-specific regulatory protein